MSLWDALWERCNIERWGAAVALTESSNKNDLEGILRDTDGTGLHRACCNRVPNNILQAMFTNIINKGIDLQQILSITDGYGGLVLHHAAHRCSLDTLKLVVLHSSATALTTRASGGRTPLDEARISTMT